MNRRLIANLAFGASVIAGASAGYEFAKVTEVAPEAITQAAQDTHTAGVQLLAVANDGSCEQIAIHTIEAGNRKNFPTETGELTTTLNDVCGVQDSHAELASTAIAGFSDLADKQSHEAFLQGKTSSLEQTLGTTALGISGGLLVGVLAAGFIRYEDLDKVPAGEPVIDPPKRPTPPEPPKPRTPPSGPGGGGKPKRPRSSKRPAAPQFYDHGPGRAA